MPAATHPILFFNRGLISRLGMARHDIARGRLSAETMTNWVPRVLGSMMIRPGFGYLGATLSNAAARVVPFVFANDDTALLEFTANFLRVWINDVLLTRLSVSTAVTNGTFAANISGWTDNDEAGATSDWANAQLPLTSTGFMTLVGTGVNAAIRDQTVTVAAPDQNVEHALRVVVALGPVTLRVGTSTSDDSYINEIELKTGTHSLSFTPTGNFNIRLMSAKQYVTLVDSCTVESSGVVSLPTRYGSSDLTLIRYDQSGDVVYLACAGKAQHMIERHAARSWSIVQYFPPDGPFGISNTSRITMTTSALTGNVVVTASQPYWKSTNAYSDNGPGSLIRIESVGQIVSATIAAQNTFTDAIRVTNVETARVFTIIVDEDAGGAATFTLQRSLSSSTGPWTDVQQWTADVTTTLNDGLDNQIVWYRLGVKTGDYVNGTHTVSLSYTLGSITGIGMVTSVANSTQANVIVLKAFGNTTASEDWSDGSWSDRRGWPSAVAFHDGRLCWAGKDKVWLSVTDAFDSFDDEVTGDSGPISRSIGNGPVDQINWMLSLDRLVLGGQGSEWSVRSSSLDEPLTPTAFSIKATSTQGSSAVQAVRIDRRGVFVQKSGSRVFELNAAADPQGTDYAAVDLTQVVPEVGEPSVVRLAVQRKPDTRVHCVLSDGTVALLVIDEVENALCWSKVDTTGGLIEDVVVLPGTIEDSVYYVVQRTISGTVRYLEKWSLESEAQGDAVNKIADSHVTYTGAATATITGLSHLNGQQVTVWANGADVGSAAFTPTSYSHTYTVTAGQITLATAATNVTVGLPYRARWKSAKLALPAALGTSLTKKKRIHGFGLILVDTHAQGLFFGKSFSGGVGDLDPLPTVRNGAPVTSGTILSSSDDGAFPFPGDWFTDARICLEARSPRPCTVVAAIADTEVYEQR